MVCNMFIRRALAVAKAFLQELSLFRARKEFSKTFIQYLLSQPNIQRDRLAAMMNVSLRTLHRYLSA